MGKTAIYIVSLALLAISVFVRLPASGAEVDKPLEAAPFSVIRLRKRQSDEADTWRATLEQFAKYRAAVDEVWFSTGINFPKIEVHQAAAERLAVAANDLRKLGILPSVQIQATIGHGDFLALHSDNSGITWQRYTASDGTTAQTQNCPRAPEFLTYMREMASAYAKAVKPYSVWVDDDIRIINHHSNGGNSGWGCHCEHCLSLFAQKEGKERTREQLLKDIKQDSELADRWRAFAFEGETELAKAIAEAVHEVSPQTRMCLQQPGACFPEHKAIYEAFHATTGLGVGMRAGAGSYRDHDARDQILKAYILARQIETIGPLPFMDWICMEVETFPRTFACRTGRGVILEALESLSQGMNAISVFAIDAGYEPPEWYGSEILSPMANNIAMLKRYVRINEGAKRAGYGLSRTPDLPLRTSSLPLDVTVGERRSGFAHILTLKDAEAVISSGKKAMDKLFSEDLIIDGPTAHKLVSSGYAGEIGLSGCKSLGDASGIRERFTSNQLCEGIASREVPITGNTYVLEPAAGATIVGNYGDDMNKDFIAGPACIMFETPSGRRRAVFGYDALGGSLANASGGHVLRLHRLADWASHGKSPILLETPTRSFVQPRIRENGTLVSIVFVNATVGTTQPVKLKLRGIPADAVKAVWSTFDAEDAELAIVREGKDALVTLPPVPAWTGGYLFFLPQS